LGELNELERLEIEKWICESLCENGLSRRNKEFFI